MIIRDFNIAWARFCPFKTNPILVIDANAVLTFAIVFKRLQMIAGRYSKFI